MCGINGIVKLNSLAVNRNEIETMNNKLSHRGPDSEGIFIDKNIGLGHRRLSIIDLSEKGRQPMTFKHKDRSVLIVYNGEIYNYQEISLDLKNKGYVFNSKTDTEVLLALYLEKGIDCLKEINGMFSFVIYDIEKKILFGARDRFGKKPLKYYLNDEKFIFSSELKAILENNIKREVDFEAINDYLTLQYVPSPKTGFKNIYKLPASHYFIFDLNRHKLKIERYFDLDYSIKSDLTADQIINEIKFLIDDSVKKRLEADVPVGVFLSGGLDSSIITAVASRYKDRIKTFSISFDKDSDDAKYAKEVAKAFNTDHKEFMVKSDDMISYIEDLVYKYEEPFADSSQLPVYIMSKLASKELKVVLTGDGGDEVFAGYDKYFYHLLFLKFRYLFKLLKPFRNFISNRKFKIILDNSGKPIEERHYNFTNYFSENEKKKFLNDNFFSKLDNSENLFVNITKNKSFKNDLDRVFYLDFNSYIPDDVNTKIDIASMANSLEARSPFLDYRICDLSSKISHKNKMNLFSKKIILKAAFGDILPKNILKRKKKGFTPPLKNWLDNDMNKSASILILEKNGLVSQIFKKDALEKILNDSRINSKKIWALMTLNIWYKKYFIDLL